MEGDVPERLYRIPAPPLTPSTGTRSTRIDKRGTWGSAADLDEAHGSPARAEDHHPGLAALPGEVLWDLGTFRPGSLREQAAGCAERGVGAMAKEVKRVRNHPMSALPTALCC